MEKKSSELKKKDIHLNCAAYPDCEDNPAGCRHTKTTKEPTPDDDDDDDLPENENVFNDEPL